MPFQKETMPATRNSSSDNNAVDNQSALAAEEHHSLTNNTSKTIGKCIYPSKQENKVGI